MLKYFCYIVRIVFVIAFRLCKSYLFATPLGSFEDVLDLEEHENRIASNDYQKVLYFILEERVQFSDLGEHNIECSVCLTRFYDKDMVI